MYHPRFERRDRARERLSFRLETHEMEPGRDRRPAPIAHISRDVVLPCVLETRPGPIHNSCIQNVLGVHVQVTIQGLAGHDRGHDCGLGRPVLGPGLTPGCSRPGARRGAGVGQSLVTVWTVRLETFTQRT